jgi:hypothetical protein
MNLRSGLFILILSIISCDQSSSPDNQAIAAAELFVDAFYSFDAEELREVLASAEESLPKMLFYQGWAKGGNYEIIERRQCEPSRDGTISCSITVKDDLISALGIDFNVTDTFHLTIDSGQVVAVNNSSNDPQAYFDAEQWVRENRPDLIEQPCEGFSNGGPTPGDCVRAMVRGYSEYARNAAASDDSRTPD